MILLQSRGPLQDGLSVVLGSSDEPKSPQTQAGAGGGTEHEEQASRTEKAHRGVLFGQSTNHWETVLEQVTSQVGK